MLDGSTCIIQYSNNSHAVEPGISTICSRVSARLTNHLVEPGHIGLGGAICNDSDSVVNKVRDLERVADRGGGCAWFEAVEMSGFGTTDKDYLMSWLHTTGWMNRYL